MFFNQTYLNVFNSTTYFGEDVIRNISTTKSTSEFLSWPPQNRNIVHGIILLTISVVGCTFNSFMIISIAPNQRLRSVRNILLLHLAGVGLLMSMFPTLFIGVISLYGYWIGGEVTCKMLGVFITTFTSVSIWTIAALSWDKYQTIASPLHHSLSATIRKMTFLFSLFWIFAILLSVPPVFFNNRRISHHSIDSCYGDYFKSIGSWYVTTVFCGIYFLPFLVLLYSYTHIFIIARTQSSRIAATMIRMTCVVQAPIAFAGQSNNGISPSIKGTKAMMTILQLVGTFTFTYFPYAIVIVIRSYCTYTCINSVLSLVVITLNQAAPVTNGAVYGLRNKILRNSFSRYIRREFRHMCYKDKRRGSIRSRTSSFRMSFRKTIQNGSHESFARTQSLKVTQLSPSRPSMLNLVQKQSLRKTQSFSFANGHTLSCHEENMLNVPEENCEESDAIDHIISIPETKEPNRHADTILDKEGEANKFG